MKIIIIANAEQEQEIRQKDVNKEVELKFTNEPTYIDLQNYDAIFILNQEIEALDFQKFGETPVFINSVVKTLSELQLPTSVSRINGWPGFLQREIWEVASEDKNKTEAIFTSLGWKIIFVKDEPGFVAARVISMIINEAFFAFGEKISTIEEIDLAMKLGTNYPFGPFEWGDKIGVNKIFELLNKLNEKDARYKPATALTDVFKPIDI